MRKLINKKWRDSSEIMVLVVRVPGPFPRVPAFGRDRVGRRTYGQQIEHHLFAIVVPAIRYPAVLGTPAVRQKKFVAVQHPLKIDAAIDAVGERRNRAVVAK